MASDSDSEIYADNLSDISSNVDISEFESDCDINEDFFNSTKHEFLPAMTADSRQRDVEGAEWSEYDNLSATEDFLGQNGVVVMPDKPKSVDEVVQLLIGDDLFDYMAEEANRYHSQNIDKFKDREKFVKWKEVSPLDMKKLFGLLLLMGKFRKDRMTDYWSAASKNETPNFAQVMSRDRFLQIWRSWHFSNNDIDVGETDRLKKIRPIVSYFTKKFTHVYKPQQELSVDECIMRWRGNLSFKACNASEISKHGVLIRMICEAKTGYICNFGIYHGEKSRPRDAILHLLQPYENLWHNVYVGDRYNSADVSKALLRKGFGSCCIPKKRDPPVSSQNAVLKKDESSFPSRKDILLQRWQSERLVETTQTIHPANLGSTDFDWRAKENNRKPTGVIDRDKFLNVDRAGKYFLYYAIASYTTKWSKRAVIFLLNAALFNAFRVFKTLNPDSNKSYDDLLHDITKEWLNDNVLYTPDEQETDTSVRYGINELQNGLFDTKLHRIVKIFTGGKKRYPQRQCRVCVTHNKKRLTCFMCHFCNVPLHKDDCFIKYHTFENYYTCKLKFV